jgi:hypothetical protein
MISNLQNVNNHNGYPIKLYGEYMQVICIFLVENFISSDGCEGVYKGCNKMAKHLQELYEEVKMTIDNWDVENACELGANGLIGTTSAP